MAKIEIIQPMLQSVEQNVLDIYQLQVISMYENVVNSEKILLYLYALNENGYTFWFNFQNGKLRFRGCDPEYIGFNGNQNIHEQFEWNVILQVKRMLTDWHLKKQYIKNPRTGSFDINKRPEMVSIELTHQQLGVLTKILKIENRRKRLQVR